MNYLISLVAFFSFLGIAGCGKDEGSGDKASAVAETKTIAGQSFNVSGVEDLPDCTQGLQGALAYIKSQGIFMGCSNEEWVEIKIEGKQGEKGDQGEQGIAGVTGHDGAAGQDGVDGEDGKDAVNVLGDEWLNPDTGFLWKLAGTAKTYSEAVALCGATYHLPTTVLPSKFYNYFTAFFSTLASGTDYWTSDVSSNGHTSRDIDLGGAVTTDQFDTSLNFVICLKN